MKKLSSPDKSKKDSYETFKKVCERNGIELDGIPCNKLIVVGDDGTEYIVDENFNLFDRIDLGF